MWKSTQFQFSRCEMAVHGQYLDVPPHTTVQYGCLYGCQNMSNLSMLDPHLNQRSRFPAIGRLVTDTCS